MKQLGNEYDRIRITELCNHTYYTRSVLLVKPVRNLTIRVSPVGRIQSVDFHIKVNLKKKQNSVSTGIPINLIFDTSLLLTAILKPNNVSLLRNKIRIKTNFTFSS